MASVFDIINLGALPIALATAIELNVFEILAKAGPRTNLSSSQIVSQLPASNPNAATTLDRILRFLSSHSILTSTIGPNGQRLYGLTPMCKDLLPDEDGVSLAPVVLLTQSKVHMDCWYFLKDAVLDGLVPFKLAHGSTAFEYYGKDPGSSKLFNAAMANHSMYVMRDVLENYRGFEGLKEVVDVGGGIGSSLKMIISKYPYIRGINFDLPYVIQNAPSSPGVKHVGGDMFESVPSGDAIFMKSILHDWDDERCLKILKNCWKVLPELGKVIILEYTLPMNPEGDQMARHAIALDLGMLAITENGKERTLKDFKALAKESGFPVMEVFPFSPGFSVIEFYKNPKKGLERERETERVE